MRELEQAKCLLQKENFTCVLCKGEETYTSRQRGVKPLVSWLESDLNFCGCSAADKVVGKATAFLYVLLGAKEVYAHTVSRPALEVLRQNRIGVEYGEAVPCIINRQGDGICPFEEAVLGLYDPLLAYEAIRGKMKQMHLTLDP